jgi:transmembrane sensor
MNHSTATTSARQVAEQAVSWLMRNAGRPAQPQAPAGQMATLAGRPCEHQRAWEHIQRVNQRLRGLSSPLAHAALNAPQSSSRRQALKLLLLLGVGSAADVGPARAIALTPLLADFSSPLGQRRKVQLPTAASSATQYCQCGGCAIR